jgi:3-oxoacyl-[acyl-carrier protein] reductase
MDLGIKDRVALVTGASQGIGFGIARAFAAEGARVALASRSRERIDAAAADLGGVGFVYDSSDLEAAAGLVADVEATLGPIEILEPTAGSTSTTPTTARLR